MRVVLCVGLSLSVVLVKLLEYSAVMKVATISPCVIDGQTKLADKQ